MAFSGLMKGRRLNAMVRKHGHRKATGVHYTPPELARFVADRLVAALGERANGMLRVLDPACGDGELLGAILESLGPRSQFAEVIAAESDAGALEQSRLRLARTLLRDSRFIHADFLDRVAAGCSADDLWTEPRSDADLIADVDIAIANPPYVRTQVLGARRAQELSQRFGLDGRVDLQHAFIVALTSALRIGGLLGIIVSNRFLSTHAGASIRKFLCRNYAILEVVDLGDTKLFEAAVLPAVIIARRRAVDPSPRRALPARFTRVYSVVEPATTASSVAIDLPGVFDVIRSGRSGRFRVSQGEFEVTHGEMRWKSRAGAVWSLTTASEFEWVERLRAQSRGVFGDYATVRVGIKTTADDVFIRSDWEALPKSVRPESGLMRPLLTHKDACRWARCDAMSPIAKVLYPHVVRRGIRKTVELAEFPRARAYLEMHRGRLEGREYVLQAGRKWYEIWVPQNPDGWKRPKIVFPDISAQPRFYLDASGGVVNGDCYWLDRREDTRPDVLYLLLAVANSRLMTRFHDLSFHNRLYSGRRRYITQYVEQYPCPDPDSIASKRIVEIVKKWTTALSATEPGTVDMANDEAEIELLVSDAFGMTST